MHLWHKWVKIGSGATTILFRREFFGDLGEWKDREVSYEIWRCRRCEKMRADVLDSRGDVVRINPSLFASWVGLDKIKEKEND